jgi:hypothetical protein
MLEKNVRNTLALENREIQPVQEEVFAIQLIFVYVMMDTQAMNVKLQNVLEKCYEMHVIILMEYVLKKMYAVALDIQERNVMLHCALARLEQMLAITHKVLVLDQINVYVKMDMQVQNVKRLDVSVNQDI